MVDVAVPGGLADITPEWMTAVLRGRGLDVEVASVTPARGSEGSGVNGVTERLLITYARGAEDAPASLVVKLPSMSAAVKGVAIRQRFYHNEIYFYDDIADKATVKIPQYYYGGIDDERQNFALLMQDMTPAVVGDDIGSCSKAEAILAVREIPKLHAPWWENPALDTFEWLPVGEPNLAVADARFANEVLPGVIRNYGDSLSPKVRGIVERYCANFTETILKMCTSPRTLTHSDYRLTNMLFGGPPEAREITVVDWQRVAIAQRPRRRCVFRRAEPDAGASARVGAGARGAVPRRPHGGGRAGLLAGGVLAGLPSVRHRAVADHAIVRGAASGRHGRRAPARTAAHARHAGVRGDGRPGHGGVRLGRSSAGSSFVVLLCAGLTTVGPHMVPIAHAAAPECSRRRHTRGPTPPGGRTGRLRIWQRRKTPGGPAPPPTRSPFAATVRSR